ncbi:hypothetical protein LDENG_00259810 [Lucifuga dentata]|nr:hypothetical protein LDENG_00259810 [Lucifuga dentata]
MIREKASIEANLYVLQLQREAAAASTEAAVFEAAADVETGCLSELPEITQDDPAARTSDYVQTHSHLQHDQLQSPQNTPMHQYTAPNSIPQDMNHPPPLTSMMNPMAKPYMSTNANKTSGNTHCTVYSSPQVSTAPHNPDLAKYLMRKELVSSGLLAFDDRPENYWAWKSSFQAVIRELDLSDQEEIDLLIKWLGPQSSAQARRIRCCTSTKHVAKDCKTTLRCKECDSDKHVSAMHPGPSPWFLGAHVPENKQSRELEDLTPTEVTSKCTEICGDAPNPRSCSKICLVNVYPSDHPGMSKRVYAVIDDQSNRSLAKSQFFDLFGISGNASSYTLKICSGTVTTVRRKINKFTVESLDGKTKVALLPILECNNLPDDKSEIHTPEIIKHFPHLRPVANKVPPQDPNACILLLLGRDILSVHKLLKTPPRPPTVGEQVFQRTPDDNKITLSVEDNLFLTIMDNELYMDEENHWVAPLPFRFPRKTLPNNREQAIQQLASLQRTFKKRPNMKTDFFEFRQKVIDNNQAEPTPELRLGEECWFLQIFAVYHPQKLGKIRVVFDSSAQFKGISLNDMLLSGPNLNNTLMGVLLRFRKEQVAITADIEQMFYCFKVKRSHRNFLRFLWHRDNDPEKEVIDYQMTVHMFGNSPLPAVAIYGLRKAAELGETKYNKDSKDFVLRNFYVDNGLTSVTSDIEAIDLLQRTKDLLAGSNLRLHKIASNSPQVMEAFQPDEWAKGLKDLDLGADPLPLQRSLGVSWDLQTDSFTFQVLKDVKPFTHRGVLSTVKSLYDPLGFASPITAQGKALARELSSDQYEWDETLPAEKATHWKQWTDSLCELEQVHIQRRYVPVSVSHCVRRELCIFSDVSSLAIAVVAYLRILDCERELAFLAVELAELIQSELDLELHAIDFYTDSRIVLGYIYNTARRFYTYVANRVARIKSFTEPWKWHYVNTDENPADHGTRLLPAANLASSSWFYGPSFLRQANTMKSIKETETFELVQPEKDEDEDER